ncbi:MAG: hypothetical protein JNK38_28760 [Acidobacteria bacterium]|nr:hypothetical protein [Acidobacteriota bacterium]
MKNIFLTAKKQRRVLALLLMVTITLSLTPLPAWATDQVPFNASFTTEFETFLDPPFFRVNVDGEGKASHMGRTTAVTRNQALNLITGLATATYTLTAANGDTVIIDMVVPVNIQTPTGVQFAGTYTVIGGTGRFAGATGGGAISGSATFLTAATGIGAFILVGTISSPGSSK